MPSLASAPPPSLAAILRQWGRIGCVGFGGPPVHVALLRELTVARTGWLTSVQFERAVAATNMLPGPASTQLAIYCAWRLRGVRGALLGGLAFILPGLVAILALAAVFLAGSAPRWLRAAGMGASAAVPAVAVLAGVGLAAPMWRAARGSRRLPLLAYGLLGLLAAALSGSWLVLVLLGCGALELMRRRLADASAAAHAWTLLATGVGTGGTAALCWTALKVGALAFGGGFVIVPLMQSDAVGAYHWMSHAQFLDAVALGQITPGPVTHTVAAVGYAAGGVPGALLAALIAFAPSFSFVLLGAARFERLLADRRVVAFLAGAAPCAAGAIVGAAIPLTAAFGQDWQYALLAGAAVWLLALRGALVPTLLLTGCFGLAAGLLGAPVSP
jgi:chromate transporter